VILHIDGIHVKEIDCPDVNGATHYKATITAQAVLLAYFELCILVPLGRDGMINLDSACHSALAT
jgi:hypothetical protein